MKTLFCIMKINEDRQRAASKQCRDSIGRNLSNLDSKKFYPTMLRKKAK